MRTPGSNAPTLGAPLVIALAATLLPLVGLLGLQAYQAFWRAPEIVNDQAWVDHTFQVIGTVQTLRTDLRDAERAERGYLLTGDDQYLRAYAHDLERAPASLARLARLTSDNSEQIRRLPDMARAIEAQRLDMQRAIEDYQHEGGAAARRIARSEVDPMPQIESVLHSTIATERALLGKRLAAVADDDRNTTRIAFLGGLLAFALTVIGTALIVLAFRHARRLELERRDMDRQLAERDRQAQAVLAQTQKMESLGQLTGGVAHDFNNVLHVIRNAVTILQRRLPGNDPEAGHYLEMIRRNSDRAATTTSRLLAFARQQPLEPRALDLNSLLAATDDLLRPLLGEGIEIETVLGSGVWPVESDRNQLENAIVNLAVNARDAMSGQGKLTLETSNAFLDERYAELHAEVKPGQYAMLAVSDSGCGMPPEVIARAFEPFFTTKELGRGTGLGLSQVFGFARQSGGHVKIYSEPGQGTTVKLYLPRRAGAAVEEPLTAPVVPLRGNGESILVVEDNPDVRAFTAQALQELGYNVTAAPDGVSALRVLEQLPRVDLLFTDVGLPNGITGRQLAERVCARRPAIKVLFTTAYARNSIIHHGRLDPGVELIVKPFSQTSLARKLRAVLEQPPNPLSAAG